ncbi:CASP-like protein 2B1 isoform X3 [Arachis stenosperma]|uniref:CASP-like protein 2B1 isoform X3 n=1 Tax=Arachis stenosperma TaxID=217475 RepID=UPI0025AD804A|nr:CASP-like protein 2B1 isoform X3 [Arachis stenosperma]
MSYLGVGVSPETVPVYHNTNMKLLDKRIKIPELVLRFMILGLGVVAAVLIGTDSQVKVVFSFEKEAEFTDVKALVFLVVANGLAAGYSLIQGLRCVVSLVRGSVLFNKPLAWAIFSADQADVGCSINCRCDTCKNMFGRKDGSNSVGVETQPEVEIEACGKEFVENASRKIEIQNSHRMSSSLNFPLESKMFGTLCSQPLEHSQTVAHNETIGGRGRSG